MKIYCAGSINAMDEVESSAARLQAAGHETTSRWHRPGLVNQKIKESGYDVGSDTFQRMMGEMDLEDVLAADALLIHSFVASSAGGFHVESGIAIGTRKPIYLLGPRRNVFDHLPQVRRVETIEEALQVIGR